MSDRISIVHWPEIVKVVTEFRDSARMKMETADTVEALWRAQGAVRALNTVLNLHEIIPALRGES